MKRFAPVAIILLSVTVAAALGLWQQYHNFLQTPLHIEEAGLVFRVESGTTVRSVVRQLEEQGVTSMNWHWRLLGRLHPVIIKTGEYQLPAGILPGQFLDLLASGKVRQYRFTIVEGWSVRQLLGALAENAALEHSLETVTDLENIEDLPAGNPEGWFLPETYVFVRGDSDLHILQRAYRAMQAALADAWAGRDTGLPYETPDELLTLASIIEKETSIESERADIAGVFVRRLLKNWRLETDPSVIYGMGESFQGNIRRSDIKNDTPYNTYTRRGLPPTPIALPGRASLQAAAHPAAGEAMFFVANGEGGHTFSSTLEAHSRAVNELIKRSKNDSGTRDKKG